MRGICFISFIVFHMSWQSNERFFLEPYKRNFGTISRLGLKKAFANKIKNKKTTQKALSTTKLPDEPTKSTIKLEASYGRITLLSNFDWIIVVE